MAGVAMPVSDTMDLWRVKDCPRAQPNRAAVRVAGTDEHASLNGTDLGMFIIDLERREVVPAVGSLAHLSALTRSQQEECLAMTAGRVAPMPERRAIAGHDEFLPQWCCRPCRGHIHGCRFPNAIRPAGYPRNVGFHAAPHARETAAAY